MRFEVLKRSNLKRNIMIGVVVVVIIIVCIITLTRAKYRTVASTTLIKGEVNFTLADLNIVAITLDDESVDALPEDGYYNLLSTSYCEVDGSPISVTLSWDNDTQALSVTPFTTRGTKCYLDFATATTKTVDTVLGEIVVNLDEPDFSKTSCSSGCDEATVGIYESKDNDGATYYWRGDVKDNYVYFANFYWRIVRINGDGSLRLIYDGKEAYDNGEASSDRQIEVSAFNSSRDKVYYVGYMYTEGEQHGNTTNSTIKEVLDEWYRKNLLNTVYEVYIADSGFCNDREMASGSTWDVNPSGIIYYAGRERISTNKSPVFTCSNSADLYTASSSKGNRALTYSIGLLTMDEVVFAGSGQSLSNSMYYLYTGEDYWTMTPMYAEAWEARVYYQSTEALTVGIVTQEYGVRPVINLSVNINLTGSGTASDPYRLSGT